MTSVLGGGGRACLGTGPGAPAVFDGALGAEALKLYYLPESCESSGIPHAQVVPLVN